MPKVMVSLPEQLLLDLDREALPSWHTAAAALGEQHRLSFHDASWAGAAQALDVPLVSADRALLAAGLAISATQAAAR